MCIWRNSRLLAGVALTGLMIVLAGCGGSTVTAAAAQGTPNPCASNTAKTVTGKVTAIAAGTASVTQSASATATVHFASTTNVREIQSVAVSTLQQSDRVQIFIQSGTSTAQAVLITPAFTGAGSGGRSFPTLAAGSSTGGFTRGCRGRAGLNGFRGISGQVTTISAVASQFTVVDTHGSSYLVSFTSATIFAHLVRGSVSDIQVGDTISASGAASSDGVTAQSIIDFKSVTL